MEKELFRIATFANWPDNLQVSLIWLVRNGFYYSGQRNMVTCYKCGIHIDGCTSDDSIVEQHRHQSPNCPLPTYENLQNISLLPVLIIGNRKSTETDHAAKNDLEKIPEIPAIALATKRGIVSTQLVNKVDRSNLDYEQLKHHLSTSHDCPSGARADPKVLAREADRVQYVFCRKFMRNWETTDIPSAEHEKHFPDCTFVRGLDVGNVSMTGESSISNHFRKTSDVERQKPVQNVQSLRTECPQPTVIEQGKLYFILDTNILLGQLQTLDSLKNEIFRRYADDFVFVVPYVVLEELEHIKSIPSGRKKDLKYRSRRAIHMLDIWTQADHSVVLQDPREANYTYGMNNGFKIRNNDDKVVHCALHYRYRFGNQHVAIGSEDLGVSLTARSVDLYAYSIEDLSKWVKCTPSSTIFYTIPVTPKPA